MKNARKDGKKEKKKRKRGVGEPGNILTESQKKKPTDV